jgi:AraC-like DNA-binding protein
MQIASELLIGGASVATVAAEIGYASEAAFSRAFKKMVGAPPSAWGRRREGVAPNVADPRITLREPLESENFEQPHLGAASHRQ